MKLEKTAERFANIIGSPVSIVIHTFAFIIWLVLPLFTKIPWDIILLSLTTAVSLEAIYLALFNQLITNKLEKEMKGKKSK